MDNLKISGIKRLTINDDPDNFIEFNPSDILFVEKFYAVWQDIKSKQTEYAEKAKELDAAGIDENGIPVLMGENIQFLKEACTFIHEKIDYLFGEGTSAKVFHGALSLDAIADFFDGISPHIWQTRDEKIKRYEA